MPDAVFRVTPNPLRWHAVCTMEEYHSKARDLHLSSQAAAAIVMHDFSTTAQDGLPDGFFHMLHVARAHGHSIGVGGPRPLHWEAHYDLGMPDQCFGKNGGGGNE